MAYILLGLTPHAADVERLFSNLGGTQGKRRSRLEVKSLEALARMRGYYSAQLLEKNGGYISKPRRTSACIETNPTPSTELEIKSENLNIQVQLTSDGSEFFQTDKEVIEGLDKEFERLASLPEDADNVNDTTHFPNAVTGSTPGPALPNEIYSFDELNRILDGAEDVPKSDDYTVHHNSNEDGDSWDIADIKTRLGISSRV